MSRPRRIDPEETDLRSWLEVGEDVLAVLIGQGASLIATERRVVLLRDRSSTRPRTGVRSWPFDRIVTVSLSEPHRGQARILLRTGRMPWEAVSMFFDGQDWHEAESFVAVIRQRQRQRRSLN
ncbi:MAG TPA: hypothetical protein VNM34_05225 [Verrucomicrobiae bacterium]|nr:hypothetical protein [Verrucomicrobiae bacterium]